MSRMDCVVTFIFGSIMIVVIVFLGSYIQWVESEETMIVSGEVIDSEFYDEYMVLEFDTGDSIKIEYSKGGWNAEILDFTVNSEMAVKFSKRSLWFMPNDDMWTVEQIIKVPDGLEE